MSKHHGYTEIEAPRVIGGLPAVYNKAFARGEVRVWVSRDVYADGSVRWHLSISCKSRYPTWDEIHDARYALLPNDITVAMILPPKEEYVNLHPNCFHLHEIITATT
jgi:hypothetical protein